MSRTTIRNIDENVLWDARIYAAQTKQTLGQVITEALEQLIGYDEECEDEDESGG